MENQHLVPGDPILIENIVSYLKAKGIFDEFRHECLADVDTKSSCQNLSQRVDGYTTKFLSGETWHPDMNKNELRNKLRRHIDESGMLAGGADHVAEQVINPKITQLFLPKIAEVVHQYLNEENEKFNKKLENSNEKCVEKSYTEISDGTQNKNKNAKFDPVADILSFSYSKPKSNSTQNSQTKTIESTKIDRKKDESLHQAKVSDASLKIDKKKEEATNPLKAPDVISKIKKEDTSLPIKGSEAVQNLEKKKEENVPVIKTESVEPVPESALPISASPAKSQSETKEIIKVKKEPKTEESDVSSDIQKKSPKEEIKTEKKNVDLKLSTDSSSHSEENIQNKSSALVTKSSSSCKSKTDSEKSKKVKSHSTSKVTSTLNESRKPKNKESSDKSSTEKHSKTNLKLSKTPSKDNLSPHKISSSKPVKTEKKDVHSKTSDNSSSKTLSSKSSSVKKSTSSMKLKTSSDKTEKSKVSKPSDSKASIKMPTESSTNLEKGHKSSFQYSSYDSSQGSDQDKSSTSSSSVKEKPKHFSKHHKKETSNSKSNEKDLKTSTKKRSHSDSDPGTSKLKHMKHAFDKQKSLVQESAKISSRSNSFGSTSSISDSPSSSKETSTSTSEETSDNSLKSVEVKKKQISKDREQCKRTEDFPPPPPPPPASGISVQSSSSAEASSMDETQSSQESDSDSKLSEEESISDSEVENSNSSNLKSERKLKTPELLNDIFDIFLYSSSSSEFEGYSSTPEKKVIKPSYDRDVDISSVHTSDLSSFEDAVSLYEDSDSDEHRLSRKLTIKEAEKLLEERARQRRLERSKIISPSKDSEKSNISLQSSTIFSEDEASSEPKRESRRERKLNPKYASSEYASIFNSKKTSFITKQVNLNEDKAINVLPTMITDAKKHEDDIHLKDPPSPMKQTIDLNTNRISDDKLRVRHCKTNTVVTQTIESAEKPMRKISNASCEHDSEESSHFSGIKKSIKTHDTKHNNETETESENTVALTVKKSIIKNDNENNMDPHPQGLKRKLKDDERSDAKKILRRNSGNSSSSENVANENNPFNITANNPSSVFNMEQKNKDLFHIQRVNNNGAVLNKIEHVRKKSLSEPNHVIEKQNKE